MAQRAFLVLRGGEILAMTFLLFGFAGSDPWSNWNKQQSCTPRYFFTPTNDKDIMEALSLARESNLSVRVVGDGHSFSPIVVTNGVLIDMSKFNAVLNETSDTVTVQSGIRIYQINAYLDAHNKALANLGVISMQSIAGATQTNTHGTGKTGGSSTSIVAFTMMLANGSVIEASESVNRDIFVAGRCGMGALGILLTLTLRTYPIWTMEQITIPLPLDYARSQVPILFEYCDNVQWCFTPYTKNAEVQMRVNTTAAITSGCWSGVSTAPVSPLPPGWTDWPPGTTACVDKSYRAMTREGDDRILFSEIEMNVAIEVEQPLVNRYIADMEKMKEKHDPRWELQLGVRYVGPDDGLLSPFYQRRTAVISFIIFGNSSASGSPAEMAMYANALQNLAYSSYQGRPHPGKINNFTCSMMDAVYSRLRDFEALRRSLDPSGMFLNAYLHQLLVPHMGPDVAPSLRAP